MSQTQICRGVATSIVAKDGVTSVTYHNTVVVEWDAKTITLNSGGWKTVTTKTRINQAANEFDLGFNLYQDNGEWFVHIYRTGAVNKIVDFYDGMVITR